MTSTAEELAYLARVDRTGYDHAAEVARLRASIDAKTTAEFAYEQEQRAAGRVLPDGFSRNLLNGAAFVLGGSELPVARWGRDDLVLWPEGEALMICSPPGIGKTTVALQIVSASLGISEPELLGLPVQPARRVLYLAMDRPNQIRRAMRRLWGDGHEAVLAERLEVWKGPLPADLGEHPETLLALADLAGADVVIVDSMKDAAVQLTDDRTGGMVNRAIQTCLAANVNVIVLHHQRKGQNGEKPKRLEDVYGSTWLTAGMGSVVLLWGQAGDALVELVHLKQPAAEVGPWTIAHDHNTGQSTVHRGFDLERFVGLRPDGATVLEVAKAMTDKSAPTENEQKKALRQLDAAVKRGRVVKVEGSRGGTGGSVANRYVLTELALGASDKSIGHAPSEPSIGQSNTAIGHF